MVCNAKGGMQMNIQARLKLLNGITVVGLGLCLVTTVIGLNAIHTDTAAAMRRLGYVANLVEIKASAMSTIMLDASAKETRDVFADAAKNIATNGEQAVGVIRRAEIKDQLSAILAQWHHYEQESQKLLKLAAGDAKGANDRVTPLYNAEFKPFQAALEKFIAIRQQEAQQSVASAETTSTRVYWGIVILLAVVTVVNVGMVMRLCRTLKKSLVGIAEALAPLRQGDLTRRLPEDSGDELGEIGKGVNGFVQELQTIVQRTRQRSDELELAAAQLADASACVLSSASQQSDATAAVAASVEQFSVSIDQVADSAVQAEQKANIASDLSRRGDSEVSGTVGGIHDIEKVVGDATRQMDELGRQAQQISSIVDVIREVSEQTNLLALNAAIEAARAGEAGRGFAVVADEVRKLAERTSTSAQEINIMVTSIQQHTDAAVDVMRHGNEIVALGARQATQTGLSMREINDSSTGTMSAVSGISSALREQRAAGTEIARNVERIAQMTEESRATAASVEESAERLKTLSEELHQEVAHFSV
jgi:methyl-accepting chemotaxis protein